MLPDRIRLSGMDYFQLLIDHHIKQHGGRCHEARLVIKLEGYIHEHEIIHVLRNQKQINQIFRLRINRRYRKGFPEAVLWENDAVPEITSVRVSEIEIPENLEWDIPEIDRLSPVHLKIIYLGDGNTGLLFRFNHIFFDYSGIELFIRSMNGESIDLLVPNADTEISTISKIKGFFNAIGFAFGKGGRNILTAGTALVPEAPVKIVYHSLEMSDADLKDIQSQLERYGVSLHESLYFIAITSQVLYNIFWKYENKKAKLAIQIPVSIRKKNKGQGILFNHLTLLYYNLHLFQLVDPTRMIKELLQSMKMQIKRSLPQSFLHFAHVYRIMPLPVYYAMMKLPTGGRLSSYNISFLGNSFQGIDKLLGHKILNIGNYPSNTIAPGITFLYYYYKGKLRITISFVDGKYSKSDQILILNKLKSGLLNGGA